MAGAGLPSFHGIIGRSAAMQALFAEIERFAPVDVPILIRGESGTGKELVGQAVRFLLSDHARYITGQTLVVDGGATLSGPERASE